MNVSAIHHCSVIVQDLAVSRQFYEGLLGLTAIERPTKPFDGIWYQIGPQQIHLLLATDDTPPPRSSLYPGEQRHVALRVNDLPALTLRLQDAGVVCTPSRSGRPVIFCTDPDGNAFELIGE